MKPTLLLSAFVLLAFLCSCAVETPSRTETDTIQATGQATESTKS